MRARVTRHAWQHTLSATEPRYRTEGTRGGWVWVSATEALGLAFDLAGLIDTEPAERQ